MAGIAFSPDDVLRFDLPGTGPFVLSHDFFGCYLKVNNSPCLLVIRNTGVGLRYWHLIGEIIKSGVLVVKTCLE